MAYPTSSGGLSVLPLPDDRGWTIIEVEPLPETTTFKLQVRFANNSFKNIELVSQTLPLRVYVNPELDQPDEWEIPAGGGSVFQVLSPAAVTATAS